MLHIGGDATNGPLRLQVGDLKGNPGMFADALDYGVGNNKQLIGTDATGSDPDEVVTARARKLIQVGTTELNNADFIDPSNNGAGLVSKIITDPDGPFTGGNYLDGKAGCMVYVQELMKNLFPDSPNALYDAWVSKFQTFISNKYGTSISPQKLSLSYRLVTSWGSDADNELTKFAIKGFDQLEVTPAAPQGTIALYQDTADLPGMDQAPVASPWEEQRPSSYALWNGDAMISPFANGGCDKRSFSSRIARRCGSPDVADPESIGDVALVRVNSIVSTVAMVSQSAVEAAGVAGVALGAAFVILDFVDGNWVGGAIGAAVSAPTIEWKDYIAND